MSVKGYKVFHPDWTCRGFQYKVGETYTHNGDIEMCGAGFHFCQKAADCFNYYSFNSDNKVAEVEAMGIVITEDDKSVTDKIRIIREIPWEELLTIVNMGKNCTGINNTGNWNTGDCNTGSCNTGDCNTGDCNTGNWNTGNRNTGNRNTGDCNTGNWNTGNRNTGDRNTGNCNTGNWNTGDRNTGNWNTGSWNSTSYSTGFFNSIQAPIYIFNKPTELSREEILNLQGMRVLWLNYENSWWINSKNMTEKEKAEHPEHETTGGYLKTVPFKTACQTMWDKLNTEDRKAVKDLPNFDAEVFREITGVEVDESSTA